MSKNNQTNAPKQKSKPNSQQKPCFGVLKVTQMGVHGNGFWGQLKRARLQATPPPTPPRDVRIRKAPRSPSALLSLVSQTYLIWDQYLPRGPTFSGKSWSGGRSDSPRRRVSWGLSLAGPCWAAEDGPPGPQSSEPRARSCGNARPSPSAFFYYLFQSQLNVNKKSVSQVLRRACPTFNRGIN